ncbi:MAG: hypothetical protein ACK5MR_17020 [Cumulibacter sp.]
MTSARPAWLPRIVAVLATALIAFGLLSALSEQRSAAVTGSDWNAGRILEDNLFYDGDSMTRAQIASFLDTQGANCTNGQAPCLKNYTTATRATSDGLCSPMAATSSSSAAAIIHRVANACGISPKVIVVMIQKESSLITTTSPNSIQYRSATGYGCPDTAPCDSQYYGFFNQVYRMALQFQYYTNSPTSYGYIPGRQNTILYNPNANCGSSSVYIENQATANLYNYTPYQPNKAALDNLYGEGNSCSAYGNRNFWRMYNDWFGGTTGVAPIGRFDSATGSTDNSKVTLTGWTIDKDSPNESGNVAVYRDGKGLGWQPTNVARPDVNKAYGVSGNHGFKIVLEDQPPGARQYCVMAIDNERSTKNPLLKCRTVQVGSAPTTAPIGRFESLKADYQTVTLTGWTIDKDSPSTSGHVAVYRYGKGLGWQPLTLSRPDVNKAYGVSGNHGFNITLEDQPTGTQNYCIMAIDNERTTTNPLLRCRTIMVEAAPKTAPIGRFDSLKANYQTVTLTGWTIDKDSPSTSGHVAVYRDGKGLGWEPVS